MSRAASAIESRGFGGVGVSGIVWREERAVIKGERQGRLGGEETGGDMYTHIHTHTLRERAEAARERSGGVQICLPWWKRQMQCDRLGSLIGADLFPQTVCRAVTQSSTDTQAHNAHIDLLADTRSNTHTYIKYSGVQKFEFMLNLRDSLW